MALIHWTDSQFSIQVDHLDEQHKRLIGMINQLHDSIQNGMGANEIAKVMPILVDFTQSHLAEEEAFMQKIRFAGYERHKKLHREFVAKVTSYLQKLKRGEEISAFELYSFLMTWLTSHIKVEDKKIGEAVKSLVQTAEMAK